MTDSIDEINKIGVSFFAKFQNKKRPLLLAGLFLLIVHVFIAVRFAIRVSVTRRVIEWFR